MKTVIKSISLALCTLTSVIMTESVFAQPTGDGWNYVSPTDPLLEIKPKYNNVNRLFVGGGIGAGIDVGTFGSNIFYEGVARFIAPKLFDVRVSYAHGARNNAFNGKTPYHNAQVSIGVLFKDEIKDRNVYPEVGYEELGKETKGNTVTTTFRKYYTDFIVQERKFSGVTASVIQMGTHMWFDESKADTTSKHYPKLKDISNPSQFAIPFQSVILGFGLHRGEMISAKAKFKYSGINGGILSANQRKFTYRSNKVSLINIEFLFAPVLNMSDAFYNDGASSAEVEDIRKRRMGFRFLVSQYGGDQTNKKKGGRWPLGLNLQAEMGLRPALTYGKLNTSEKEWFGGFMNMPWYWKFNIGFGF
jgi:hypothetical protein